MIRLALAAALVMVAGSVAAKDLPIFLFDVLHRPTYRAAYQHMLQGERDLPSWMATAEAAENSTDTPGSEIKIGADTGELFQACKPHECSDNQLVVVFTDFNQRAVGVVFGIGRPRLLGKPNVDQARALLSRVE